MTVCHSAPRENLLPHGYSLTSIESSSSSHPHPILILILISLFKRKSPHPPPPHRILNPPPIAGGLDAPYPARLQEVSPFPGVFLFACQRKDGSSESYESIFTVTSHNATFAVSLVDQQSANGCWTMDALPLTVSPTTAQILGYSTTGGYVRHNLNRASVSPSFSSACSFFPIFLVYPSFSESL